MDESAIGVKQKALFNNFELKRVEKGIIEVIASTEDRDRSGEVVEVSGWDLKNFNAGKGGPILVDHNNSVEKIVGSGKARIENNKLVIKIKFATDVEANGLAEFVSQMVDKGFINDVSVGFIPKSLEFRDKKIKGEQVRVLYVTEQELLELSFVAVPANAKTGVKLYKSLNSEEKVLCEKFLPEFSAKYCEKAEQEQEMTKLLNVLRDNHSITKSYRKAFEKIRNLLGLEAFDEEAKTIETIANHIESMFVDFKKVASTKITKKENPSKIIKKPAPVGRPLTAAEKNQMLENIKNS